MQGGNEMNHEMPSGLRNTFLIHSIAMAFFAGIYMFFPVLWGNWTGCLSNRVPQVYRLWGLTILGYAITSFLACRETTWEKVQIVAQMERIISALFPVALLLALLFWDLPAIGWMPLVVMSGFAIAFNVCYPRN
jgi:hypothetical protein